MSNSLSIAYIAAYVSNVALSLRKPNPSVNRRTSASLETRSSQLPATLALMAGALLLAGSFWLPYWEMKLVTPDRPQGSRVVTYLHEFRVPLYSALASAGKLGGARLSDLAKLESSLALGLVTVVALLVIAVALPRKRWAALLVLPAFSFSLVAIADSVAGLTAAFESLAAASGPVGATWTFPIFGRLSATGVTLDVRPGTGLFLAIGASIAVVAGLCLRFRAHRPAADAGRDPHPPCSSA